MKSVRQLIWMVSLPLLMLTGCSRRELLDSFPVVAVQVQLDWGELSGAMPEGMRIIFYPRDEEGRKVDIFLPVGGGEVKVPPGRYSVVVYNYDTESVLICGEESYETLEAYTNLCQLGIEGTERMVWGPDALYTAKMDNFTVDDKDEPIMLQLQPKPVVKTYHYSLKVKGLKNVGSALGSIEGMADHYLLGKGYSVCDACPIYFEVGKGEGVMEGSFTTFGMPEQIVTRAETGVIMNLILIKVDRSVQEIKIDITQAVTVPGEGGDNTSVPEIKLPEGSQIEVEDVVPLPDGGGIGGDVGGWDDETEVELPMK